MVAIKAMTASATSSSMSVEAPHSGAAVTAEGGWAHQYRPTTVLSCNRAVPELGHARFHPPEIRVRRGLHQQAQLQGLSALGALLGVVAHVRQSAAEADLHQGVLGAELGQHPAALAFGAARHGGAGSQSGDQGHCHDGKRHQHFNQGEAATAV